MHSRRYLIFCSIAIGLAVPAQTPEPGLRTTVSEVLLDVAVRDRKGHIIPDLRPDEIQVFEDGIPQKVRHFEFIGGQSNAQRPSTSANVEPPTSVSEPTKPQSVQELHEMDMVSIVVETSQQLRDYDRSILPKLMREFLQDELRPNTYVGLFGLDQTLRVVQPYTNDAQRISAAVDKLARRPNSKQAAWVESPLPVPSTGPLTGLASIYTQLQGMNYESELREAYVSSVRQLMAIRDLVRAQAQIPGRKVVLLVTDGVLVHPDTIEVLKGAISAANRANVTVYGLDVRAFEQDQLAAGKRLLAIAANASARRQMSRANGGDQVVTADEVTAPEMAESSIKANSLGNLVDLSESTGGKLLTGDVRGELRRVMEDLRSHYEVTYSPVNAENDGSFRKIEVRVSRPGAKAFTRNGYYALPTINGQQIYPFEMATLKALNMKPQLHQFDFQSATLQFRPGPQKTQMAFVFQSPLRDLTTTKEGEWLKFHVCVTALVKNDQGQVLDRISKDIPYQVPATKSAELHRGVVSFTAPFFVAPGRYTLETAAVDREGMKASVSRSVFVVEQGSSLSVSDVAVVRRLDAFEGPGSALDPLQARGAKVTPELSDIISPEAGREVKFYAVAYPPAPVDAQVKVNIEIWRDGKVVLQTPASDVSPDVSGAASILVSVPIENLTAGQYEARVSFQYKGQTVSKIAAFSLPGGR